MSLSYKNILVAVDGSDEAELAFKKALTLAKENDATVIIAHVIDTRSFAAVQTYDQAIASRTDEYAKELINKYRLLLEEAGVTKIETVIDFGSPRIKIPKAIAPKYNADLILCGATGLSAMERLIIGSVSESIIRNAPCDVLIVRS